MFAGTEKHDGPCPVAGRTVIVPVPSLAVLSTREWHFGSVVPGVGPGGDIVMPGTGLEGDVVAAGLQAVRKVVRAMTNSMDRVGLKEFIKTFPVLDTNDFNDNRRFG
jgi:hypothetical protein